MRERLFDYSPDAIVLAGADGRIREANVRAELLFGYTREEFVGLPVEGLIPERFRGKHVHYREDYQRDPHTRPMGEDLELFGRRKDGSEFPADIMLNPVTVDGEQVVIAVVRDITRRKQIEAAYRASEERFRLLVEGARDYAIIMLDAEGRVMTWNSGAQQIKGYAAEEIVGRHFSRFYLTEEVERGKPDYELNVARAEGRFEDEGWRVRNDGSRFWANVIITALHDKSGTLIGFCKVTRDFTTRKKAEESLLQQLSGAVLTQLDIQQMLKAIAASIRAQVRHDYAHIALYEEHAQTLRRQFLDESGTGRAEEQSVAIEGTADGWAFTRQLPLVMGNAQHAGLAEEDARPPDARVKSGVWLPLNSQGKVIGTLFVGSYEEHARWQKDLDMLLQIANTTASALDNTFALRQIAELSDRLREEKRYLEEELRTEYSFEEIVGESAGLKRVLKHAETVARTDATVLLLGETGTGKELIARALHNLSGRSGHTFVKLNCSAIPLGLLESELFGHERGAFTGAITQRIGRLELAHQGTLFLDEIGDLPLELQPKLLRALQEKEIERLGGKRTIAVDVRLVAATNRDLAAMVKEGSFRADLYYRLRVFPITIPPLRERREDIPLLVNYFVAKHARRMNKHITSVPADVMGAVKKWRWPGNVRELENFIERAVILTQGPALRAPLAELSGVATEDEGYVAPDLRTAEREHILRALREAGGVIGGPGGAAERLGVKRTTLNSKMKKLGIEKQHYAR